ncbi:MAG: lipopolysaccharide core heptose(I) kinase RfaP [Methylotenera sp.]
MWTKQYLSLPEHLRKPGEDMFAYIMQMQGKAFRDVGIRKTIQVSLNGKSYFVKQHFGVGWREIFKNLISFKVPIVSAITEVSAIQKLEEVGIATTPLVAYGVKGSNPATQQSFIITQDLGDITSLEDVCADWQTNPPEAAFKQTVVIAMAKLAAKLHAAGLCHRDFYLCHLALNKAELSKNQVNLILIDLHRVLLNQSPYGKTVMKDISGLVFSTMNCGFTAEDWALFKEHYLPQSEAFWVDVNARANKLYTKFHSDKFQKRLAVERLGMD